MINIKNDNQKLILQLIRNNKEISGAELSRITMQRRSTLAYTLKSLEEMGLISVSRIGETTSSGGKPPTLWKLVENSGYFIGLEVTPKEIRTVITDFASNIIYRDIHVVPDILSIGGDLQDLANFILSRINALNLNMDKIIGIGIAIPGMIHSSGDFAVYYTANGVTKIDIKNSLHKRLNLDVELINDANAGALGEKWFSHYPEKLNNMIFLSINEDHAGIGAGFIFNGQLYTGFSGSAGEFIPFGIKLKNIFDSTNSKYNEDFSNYNNISKIATQIEKKSPLAIEILNKIASLLALEIARLITLLNPRDIVIGGDFSITKGLISEMLDKKIRDCYLEHYPQGIEHPYLKFSKQGIYSGAMGATAIFVDYIFNPLTNS